jgi:hypothetical protein
MKPMKSIGFRDPGSGGLGHLEGTAPRAIHRGECGRSAGRGQNPTMLNSRRRGQGSAIRAAFLFIAMAVASAGEAQFGVWKMNSGRSTLPGGSSPRSVIVRIQPHAKGEVFTLERIEADGRMTSSSTILYFDGASRDFQDFGCSGTQSSRRLDGDTVEILRRCRDGAEIRFVRRRRVAGQELIFDVTEQHPDGRRIDGRLVLEKQASTR